MWGSRVLISMWWDASGMSEDLLWPYHHNGRDEQHDQQRNPGWKSSLCKSRIKKRASDSCSSCTWPPSAQHITYGEMERRQFKTTTTTQSHHKMLHKYNPQRNFQLFNWPPNQEMMLLRNVLFPNSYTCCITFYQHHFICCLFQWIEYQIHLSDSISPNSNLHQKF